jgi:hypothetical protein
MIEILKKYPKATEVIRKHYSNLLLQNFKGEKTKEIEEYFASQSLSDEQMAKLIEINPYHLVYVFDENDIFISIIVHVEENGIKDDVFFRYAFDNIVQSKDFNSRKEAEKEAIVEAFRILEDKL